MKRVITRNKKTREELANIFSHLTYQEQLDLSGAADLADKYILEGDFDGYVKIKRIDETEKNKPSKNK